MIEQLSIQVRQLEESMKEYKENTVKIKWRIINPHYAFMTVKSVYEPGVPFHKTFFLEKLGKGLCSVANSYTLLLVSLLINSSCIDQRTQP